MEVAAKMTVAQEYDVFVPCAAVILAAISIRKAPLTCQSDFNDQNKNNCKGKMFWLTR